MTNLCEIFFKKIILSLCEGSNSNKLASSVANVHIHISNCLWDTSFKYIWHLKIQKKLHQKYKHLSIYLAFLRTSWEGSIWKPHFSPPLNSGDILNIFFFLLNVFVKVIDSWTNHSDVFWPAITFKN